MKQDLSLPSKLQILLRQHEKTAKRSLGQNYLIDKNTLLKIVNEIIPKEHQAGAKQSEIPIPIVVEIGSGLGVLSAELLQHNIKLFCIEIEQRSISIFLDGLDEHEKKLQVKSVKEFLDTQGPAFFILQKDVFDCNFNQLLGKERLIFCGNLPYSLSARLSLHLLEHHHSHIRHMVFLMQKEVALRIAALSSHAGIEETSCLGLGSLKKKQISTISYLCAWFAKIETCFPVSANCFYPKPRVESLVLRFSLDEEKALYAKSHHKNIYQLFKYFVQGSFQHRRKNFLNSIKHSMASLKHGPRGLARKQGEISQEISIQQVQNCLHELGLTENIRAEEISMQGFFKLCQCYRQSAALKKQEDI